VLDLCGAPGMTRTCGTQIRNRKQHLSRTFPRNHIKRLKAFTFLNISVIILPEGSLKNPLLPLIFMDRLWTTFETGENHVTKKGNVKAWC